MPRLPFLSSFLLPIIILQLTHPTLSQPCLTDDHCSLNGLCLSSTCTCDPGWTGPDCGILHLSPATLNTGYNHTSYTSPSHFSNHGNSSWGGNIIHDPHDAGLFHLFIDTFAHGCGLSAWRPTSYVVRAESRLGPQGPYTWAQDVSSGFRHNSYVHWSPWDGKWLLWTIGVSVPDDAGEGGSCKSVSKDAWPNNISVASAGDVRGPWSAFEVKVNGTNPAPLALWSEENRTGGIVLGAEDLKIYAAERWNGTYELVNEPGWNISDYSTTWTEDPFLWRDKRGHYHALAHWMIDIVEKNGTKYPRVGAHMFSRTLEGEWQFKVQEAFSSVVEFTDGSVMTFKRRERPKLFFSEDGEVTPLYLVTGVQEMGESGKSYTLVQPIGDRWREFEEGLGLGEVGNTGSE